MFRLVGIVMPDEEDVPSGAFRDLVAALHDLYRRAGKPGTREISKQVNKREDLPDTISHEGVSALLKGENMPRWAKVECVVRVLAARSIGRPDVEAEVQRIHALWLAAADIYSESRRPLASTRRAKLAPVGGYDRATTYDIVDLADGYTRITVTGAIDFLECTRLNTVLYELQHRPSPALHLELDLRRVDFIDSAGGSVLVRQSQQLADLGGSLRMECSATVFRVICIMGLEKSLNATFSPASDVDP